MSQLLISDLTALSSETRRKNPEVKVASDAALAAIKSDERALLKTTRENIKPEEDVLLKPFILACSVKTSSAKVISLAIGLLQRIIGVKAIKEDETHLDTIVDILTEIITSRADVDVHLKVLQVVSSLLSTYHSIHDQLLSKTLQLCFKLQESRIAVVSSTAAATLRQAVMIIFEKVKDEDIKRKGDEEYKVFKKIDLPGTGPTKLFPCSSDAYYTISDLNNLANGDLAPFLFLPSLPKTFTLELIESILTNHSHLFRSQDHPELLYCLRQSTCPLLIRAFNEQAAFPTTLRLMRLLFVLLRQFSTELVIEVEILMSILLKCVSPSNARKTSSSNGNGRSSIEVSPPWQRVLAMEATRSLCADGVFLRNLWKWFDAKENSARVFTNLVDTLHQLGSENPAIMGKAEPEHQMSDAPRASEQDHRRPSNERGYSSLYGAAAGVANAAISGFSTISESSPGLSQTSVPSIQLIDQLDKSEAPTPPSTYIYLLALQSLVHLAQSLAAYVLPAYSTFVNARPSTASRAPPALDMSTVAGSEREDILAVQGMLQQSWAPLLHSFTFFLTSKCDDVLFAEVLVALRNFTNATGVLSLESPRDALIATLTRFAVPRSVISKLVSLRGKAASSTQDDIDCTLSERNAACLKAVTQIAYYLSGSLTTHWRDILETLCDAEFVLRKGGSRKRSRSNAAMDEMPQSPSIAYQPKASMASISALSTVPPGFYSAAAIDDVTGRPMALSRIDSETLLMEISRVFENTEALGDTSLLHFIEALCELDADSSGLGEVRNVTIGAAINRSFPLSALSTVIMLNVQRLTVSSIDLGWSRISQHLLLVCDSSLSPPLRMQAAEVLDTFLKAAMESTSEDASNVQKRTIEVLTKQCILQGKRQFTADIDVRRSGLETLLTILEQHGHSLLLGWESIFELCSAASTLDQPSEDVPSRSTIGLIKVAFTCLQLVCSDLLTKLDLEQLRHCVQTLTTFSKQSEDINVALTANGTIWAVTAEISTRADGYTNTSAGEISSLWIYVLTSVLELAADERSEVRNGAIAILFNILEQYGLTLSKEVWTNEIIKLILFPLLNGLKQKYKYVISGNSAGDSSVSTATLSPKQWEESRVLALTSTGKVIQMSLFDKLIEDSKILETLLQCLQDSFLDGPANISQAAIRSLLHILQASIPSQKVNEAKAFWQQAWQTWLAMGEKLVTSNAVQTQANLLTYVKTLEPIYRLLGQDMQAAETRQLLIRLKVALTYSKSQERISDSDRLSALQAAILDAIATIQSEPSTASMILQDLAEYSTLAFTSSKQATYLALNQASTEMMSNHYKKWSEDVVLYQSGAVSQLFAALSIPLKLRYDCPKSSQQEAIWKGSLITFCKSTALCCKTIDKLPVENNIKADVWSHIQRAITAALNADSSAMREMTFVQQQEEQVFDLMLLATIERDIWPFLGRQYVPSSCIGELASALANASRLSSIALPRIDDSDSHSEDKDSEESDDEKVQGILIPVEETPRELFAYWSFDLLLMMSSGTKQSHVEEGFYKRVAALSLPSLIERMKSSLVTYVAEIKLRGRKPQSRIKDEEINYILHQLQNLRLWSSSLLVTKGRLTMDAFLQQEEDLKTETLYNPVAWHTLKSPKGMLFLLYPQLCDLVYCLRPQQSGSSALLHQSPCQSSMTLLIPVKLPEGFELGRVGQSNLKGPFQLYNTRDLARGLLDEVGNAWQ